MYFVNVPFEYKELMKTGLEITVRVGEWGEGERSGMSSGFFPLSLYVDLPVFQAFCLRGNLTDRVFAE